ncbi:MAG TPA: flagellar basal body-associated FliL family protein [Hyphomicrobiales bacterium]|nr:flagellar basal body-associated FliL family protein [Hyphomicrobiales bacterium]
MKAILIAIILVLLAVPAGLYSAGLLHFGAAPGAGTETANEAQIPPGLPPQYLTLDPPFVVNFVHRGTLRYLQVSLDLMYQDPALLAKVTERMPEVRNALILLFSNQEYDNLSTLDGKELLRLDIMRAIDKVLGLSPDDRKAAGEVFITNFVMQ